MTARRRDAGGPSALQEGAAERASRRSGGNDPPNGRAPPPDCRELHGDRGEEGVRGRSPGPWRGETGRPRILHTVRRVWARASPGPQRRRSSGSRGARAGRGPAGHCPRIRARGPRGPRPACCASWRLLVVALARVGVTVHTVGLAVMRSWRFIRSAWRYRGSAWLCAQRSCVPQVTLCVSPGAADAAPAIGSATAATVRPATASPRGIERNMLPPSSQGTGNGHSLQSRQ